MMYRRNNRFSQINSESGVAMELFALAIPVILMLGSLVLNTGYISLKNTEVQKASDEASHAGTMSFDMTEKGWNRARQAAITMLLLHQQELMGISEIDFTEGGPEWENENLKVSIRRGQYQERSDSSIPAFVSFEPEDNPRARFRTVLANAVKVQLEFRNIGRFFPNLANGSLSFQGVTISTDSLGVIDQTGGVRVPPLAIPICALLNEEDKFDAENFCENDRYFAPADIRDDTFAWQPPSFLYDPAPNDPQDKAQKEVETACHWKTPHYQQRNQNWGVIGIPEILGLNGTLRSNDVRRILSSGDGMIEAVIGQRFRVLQEFDRRPTAGNPGTDAQDFGDNLWRLISNLGQGDSNPTFEEGFKEAFENGAAGRIQPNWVYPHSRWGDICEGNRAIRPTDQIVCGSRRFDWDGCDGNNKCEPKSIKPAPNAVWRVQLPVIADVGASGSCAETPAPTGDGEYQIVGFLKAIIYDTDIGLNYAPYAENRIYEDTRAEADADAPTCNHYACDLSDEASRSQREFGIFLGRRQSASCGVIRARLECSLDLLADPNGASGPRHARLVE